MSETTPQPSSGRLDRQDYLWLAALLVAFSFLFMWNSWSYSLWDPWEPKYAGTVTEMRERGEVITPWFNDKIRWTKPVLTYWLMYVPIAIFGNTEFTARLPMMLMGVGGVLWLYYVMRRLFGRTTAIVSACVLGTLPQYFYMARQAMPDMPLNFFIGLAMGFFVLARFDDVPRRRYFLLFYAGCALAFLTKGPVSAVLIIGAVGIFWSIDFRREMLWPPARVWSGVRELFTYHNILLGTLVFIAVAGPWYGAMWIKHGDTFIEYFFGDENLDRFNEPLRGHHGTLEHYVGTMFRGFYPWIGVLPLGAVFLFQGTSREDDEARKRWFFAAWFAAAFLLFTAAGTKLDHYIFPITIPTAALIGLVLAPYFEKKSPYWLGAVLVSSIPFVWLPINDFRSSGSQWIFDVFITKRDIDFPYMRETILGFFILWAVVTVLAVLVRRSKVVAALAMALAFGQGVYFTHYVMPSHAKFRSMKSYIEEYERLREPDAELVFYGWMRYTMYYYYGKDNFRHYEYNEVGRLDRFVRSRENVYVIAHKKYVDRLYQRFRRNPTHTLQRLEMPAPHARFVMLKKVPVSAVRRDRAGDDDD